jgi:hypothetical protein
VPRTPKRSRKMDRNKLPPELRGVPEEQLAGAIRNSEKALRQRDVLEARRNADHTALVESGKALDIIEAAKRCYSAGSHGNEELGVKKSG